VITTCCPRCLDHVPAAIKVVLAAEDDVDLLNLAADLLGVAGLTIVEDVDVDGVYDARPKGPGGKKAKLLHEKRLARARA